MSADLSKTETNIQLSMTRPDFLDLGLVPYADTYQRMLDYVTQENVAIEVALDNQSKNSESRNNQFWFLQHEPIFTQGIRSHQDNSSSLNIRGIDVVNTDRGGLITYHGPGQLTIYAICHLNSKNVRRFVNFLEQVVIDTLLSFDIKANRRDGMPGVYVDEEKIASIGLRIKNGMSYHGISLNVDMDLTPFSYIDPCGYQGLEMTQMINYNKDVNIEDVKASAKSCILSLIDIEK